MDTQEGRKVVCDWSVNDESGVEKKQDDRRIEQRLRYHWPVWFAEDFEGALSQGQMVDVSSGGAAFTYYPEDYCPHPDQYITTRFSVPSFGDDESFEMTNYIRKARVCRVDHVNDFMRRIVVQFTQELPFKPGEQTDSELEAEEKMRSVMI